MPEPTADRLYYRDDPAALATRPLDGLTLIYHRPSGITHIVDSPVPEIMAALSAAPQSADALMEQLSAIYRLDQSTDNLAGLVDHLENLCILGLVRAV